MSSFVSDHKNKDNKPIFRHITHTWTSNSVDNAWEITGRPEMVKEAVEVLQGLKSKLTSTLYYLTKFPIQAICMMAETKVTKHKIKLQCATTTSKG